MLIFPDVIRCQIRENADIKLDARGAVELQALGGYLHDNHLAARIHHLGEVFLHLVGLRRGVVGRDVSVADDNLDGADKAGGDTSMLQDGSDHEGSGGLALGSGNADDLQLLRRILEVSCGYQGQGVAGIFHQYDSRARRYVHRALGHDDYRAVLRRLACHVVAVEGGALDADEHALLLYFSGIVYKLADIDVDAAAYDFIFQIFQ